ncbi:MAG: tRNA 2-selenouridine(34) synthase MnmH [Prolixibacteraceae bacterium]|jgi:tRNA 2-selenouridine synthase|nr:tRNA 2-selenouridine(34) synthase MnmH [Prolixibacteraceae bacterium]
MVTEITIQEAFELKLPIIDVRSPGEFEKGHIPNATNICLFNNDERAHVGTVYKQQSKEEAIELGYTYVNPKLKYFIDQANTVAPKGNVIVHCWRGGMRSRSFAQHISDNGISNVKVIVGGYKAYRNYLLKSFEHPFQLKILGGYTGSGKTYILKELSKLNKQVIDLEGIANHKGSAFGNIGEDKQPTVEQIENNLFEKWQTLDYNQPIWLEDESHNIGGVKIPMPLFNQMRSTNLFFIDIPKEERAKHLVTEYTNCGSNILKESVLKISRR